MNGLDVFRALADDVRLRVLGALLGGELSVAELVDALDLPQSTVSRHLKPLREVGLVTTRREGTSVYYRRDDLAGEPELAALLDRRLRELPTASADAAAVRRVVDARRLRSREFFERMAGRYGSRTQPGGGWEALASGLAAGFAGRVVADLGAGEGALTLLLARFAKQVIAVDQSRAMLDEVRRRAAGNGVGARVRVEEGDLEALPLKKASVDDAFLSQSLHHAARPGRAIAEAARILRPGGRLIVLDLARHEQEWARTEWADQWLGFESDQIAQWMCDAGLRVVVAERSGGGDGDLAVILLVGVRSEP